jgi:hypothetical protein
MPEEQLTHKDLNLLMESYKNMFLMHQTILDQQTQMSTLLQKITENQSKSCRELEGVSKTLKECVDELRNSQKAFTESMESIKGKIGDHDIESLKGHNSIKNKVYFALGGSITALLTMLGMFWKMHLDSSLLHQIYHIVLNLADKI